MTSFPQIYLPRIIVSLPVCLFVITHQIVLGNNMVTPSTASTNPITIPRTGVGSGTTTIPFVYIVLISSVLVLKTTGRLRLTLCQACVKSLWGLRSSTSVAKNISLQMSCRGYPITSKPLLMATAATFNKQLASTQSKLLYNKAIFLRYCEHFEKYSLHELLNDHKFIQIMSRMVTEAPSLQTRAFQLAVEVSYSRRKFSLEALQESFQSDFTIKDVYVSNRGLCDQSTIYSSILMKFVKAQLKLDAASIQVNVTPLYLPKAKSLIVEQAIAKNQILTGNRSPDTGIY